MWGVTLIPLCHHKLKQDCNTMGDFKAFQKGGFPRPHTFLCHFSVETTCHVYVGIICQPKSKKVSNSMGDGLNPHTSL